MKDISALVLVTLFFGIAAYVFHLPSVRKEIFDLLKWRAFLRGFGETGNLVFVCVFALANGCGLPRLWICAIAGALYGAHMGTWIAMVSTLLGATMNFFFGKWLLRGLIKRRLTGRSRIWHDRFRENAFYWVLYIRLFPFGNATITNLISGASRMRYIEFFLATFLGYLPFTITFALFGSSASKQKPSQLVMGAFLFAVVLVLRWIYSTKQKHKEESIDGRR
jgi:uncharacterized membrane protein YdjX (TVP38/TMEM64 family)